MVPAPHPSPATPDAADSRARLLSAALRLFAENGFAKTSIRQIAEAAGANTALISYYFGDKKGLYNAAYAEPLGGPLRALFSGWHWMPKILSCTTALVKGMP